MALSPASEAARRRAELVRRRCHVLASFVRAPCGHPAFEYDNTSAAEAADRARRTRCCAQCVLALAKPGRADPESWEARSEFLQAPRNRCKLDGERRKRSLAGT